MVHGHVVGEEGLFSRKRSVLLKKVRFLEKRFIFSKRFQKDKYGVVLSTMGSEWIRWVVQGLVQEERDKALVGCKVEAMFD